VPSFIEAQAPDMYRRGERHRHDLEGPPRQELREPGIFPRILLSAPQYGNRPDDKNSGGSRTLQHVHRLVPRHVPHLEHRRTAGP
jgi:hypothetical protein